MLPFILFASTFCFACGILLPLIQVKGLFVFTDEPSLIGIVSGLWNEGDMLLSAVIALFSLFSRRETSSSASHSLFARTCREHSRLVPGAGQLVMLDVVLVALVIFAAKRSGVATAFTKPGLWFFAVSVLLTAAASALTKHKPAET